MTINDASEEDAQTPERERERERVFTNDAKRWKRPNTYKHTNNDELRVLRRGNNLQIETSQTLPIFVRLYERCNLSPTGEKTQLYRYFINIILFGERESK